MEQRDYIKEQVELCLALSPEEAAQRHIQYEAAGWNMQFGFLPFERHRPSLDEVVSEVAKAIGFHILQCSVDLDMVRIDAYSVGHQQMSLTSSEPVRFSRGVGVWMSSDNSPLTSSDET